MSPYISTGDIALYIGLYNAPIMFYLGWKNEIAMNPFRYEWRVIFSIFLICLFAVLSNYCIFRGNQLIESSKQTFIISFVPLWWAILGAIFLKEFINILTLVCIIGSSIAIYILAISKHEVEHDHAEGILGYILIFDATWLTGWYS